MLAQSSQPSSLCAGSQLGSLSGYTSSSVAVDVNGYIYILSNAVSGGQVYVTSSISNSSGAGVVLFTFTPSGLDDAQGIAVDKYGAIYIGNTFGNTILVLNGI